MTKTRKYSSLSDAAVATMRRSAKEGLGFNCTFVDDDMNLLIGLAQRAVLAGLITDLDANIQSRFREAAERHRVAHESALGRSITGDEREKRT
jgi:hypothetical protein